MGPGLQLLGCFAQQLLEQNKVCTACCSRVCVQGNSHHQRRESLQHTHTHARLPAAGGPDGVKGVASKLVEQHQLDDTFYIVDLANVVRLFKVCAPARSCALVQWGECGGGVVGSGKVAMLTSTLHPMQGGCAHSFPSSPNCRCARQTPVNAQHNGRTCTAAHSSARFFCPKGEGAGHGVPCLPTILASDPHCMSTPCAPVAETPQLPCYLKETTGRAAG